MKTFRNPDQQTKEFKTQGMRNRIQIDCTGIGNFNNVKEAVMMANAILAIDPFYDRIAAHSSFDMADISPTTIARLMKDSSFTMTLHLYYSLSPVKNIDGYDDQDDPFAIHMNIWKIDRSPESMCNTIIHACVHAVNACNDDFYFGHGDEALYGKENTAPYWIGALAQSMMSDEEAIIIPLEHDIFQPRIINQIKKQFTNTEFTLTQ
jgi:hypothetical protein